MARIPELLTKAAAVDITHLNEQQFGVALSAWNERAHSGSIRSGDWVTHHRSGQAEIDFVGRCADNGERATPLDGKFISGSWKRDALSIRNSTFGSGILATRDVLSVDPDDPVWAVPASFIAYALANPV